MILARTWREMRPAVGLFVPCYVDQLWPQAGRAAVELIERAGLAVHVADAVCCGQALSNAGETVEGDRVRRAWERAHRRVEEVVVLSASCAGHLESTADPAAMRPRVREFCAFYVDLHPRPEPRSLPRTLALHTSCSALRETRTAGAARELLGAVPRLQVVEPSHWEECCGFGGSFATTFADLSVKMGSDKVTDLLAAGDVDGIVSSDCSCLLHLRALAPPETEFFHVAEVLLEASR